MATKIKLNTIGAQIDYIDQMVAEATGIDLKERARKAIQEREALRSVGKRIFKGVAFDASDNQMVLVSEFCFDKIH